MRVAMIGPFGLRPKGTMSYRALPMAKALVTRGHRVTMFLPPFHTPEEAGKSWQEAGVQITNVALGPQAPLMQHVWITYRLVRAALLWQPDVVHCFKPKAYAGLSAWAIWHWRRLRHLHLRLVMDTDDWEGPGGWNDLETYSKAQKRFFAWQEGWGLRHADAVTAGSRTLETLAGSLGVDRARLVYVPNGIRHRSDPSALPDAIRDHFSLVGRPVVLLYTRFFEYRLDRLLATWRLILDRCPAARLLVVGAGLFGEHEQLLAMARAMPGPGGDLSQTIVYAGWTKAEEIPAYYQAADVAIYPLDDTLLNRAKCPVKLVDLLAAGMPVVADAVGQAQEYIRPDQTGILVPPGDTAAMAEAVVRLLNDPAGRTALGGQAKIFLGQHFSWDRLVLDVERAYGL